MENWNEIEDIFNRSLGLNFDEAVNLEVGALPTAREKATESCVNTMSDKTQDHFSRAIRLSGESTKLRVVAVRAFVVASSR